MLIVVVLYIPNNILDDPISVPLSSHIEKLCAINRTPMAEQESNITIMNNVSVKRSVAAFSIVVVWTRLLFQITQRPGRLTEYLNKHILMYRKVLESIMKLLCIYGVLVGSFAIGFYLMFHNDLGKESLRGGENLSPYYFFDTPGQAIMNPLASTFMHHKLHANKSP